MNLYSVWHTNQKVTFNKYKYIISEIRKVNIKVNARHQKFLRIDAAKQSRFKQILSVKVPRNGATKKFNYVFLKSVHFKNTVVRSLVLSKL